MLIDSNHSELSISRQCGLVSISRSTFYYDGLGESELTLELMRRIDEQFLETPFYGSRQMARWLRREGFAVSRRWCAVTSVRRGPGHRDGRRGMIST